MAQRAVNMQTELHEPFPPKINARRYIVSQRKLNYEN